MRPAVEQYLLSLGSHTVHPPKSRQFRGKYTGKFATLANLLLALVAGVCSSKPAFAQGVIAQINDTHICDSTHAPHAASNLNTAVQMINRRVVDAVIVSGDIGESKSC